AGSITAQIGGAPSGSSPTIDTDVSSLIATGCGYDAWTGASRRRVFSFEVPGAISEHGLKWESGGFGYNWMLFHRPYYTVVNATFPDGRQSHFEVGTKERYFQGLNADGITHYADLYLDEGSVVHFDYYSDYLGGDPP